jgi:transposase
MASKTTCKHVNSARTSLESLAHLQLNGSSAGKIKTDLTKLQSQLAKLKGQTHGALASQIDALSASLKQVEKAALGIHSSPSASQITAVVASLHALKAQSKATIAAMHAACP